MPDAQTEREGFPTRSTCEHSAVNTQCPRSVNTISLTSFEPLFIQGNSNNFQKHTSHSSAQTLMGLMSYSDSRTPFGERL